MGKTKVILLLTAAVILLVAGVLILRTVENNQYAEKRGDMSDGFGQLKIVEFGGSTYREKPAITTLLIAGIDKAGDDNGGIYVATEKYRSGGPADFLVLLAVDHTEKKIHQLQIDRDTITDVMVLGVFGNEVGSRKLQICLSHGFGETPVDNANNTVRAVQNLLGGLEINGYYMFDYSAVPVLNDALGGVPVTIKYDMTSVYPSWTKGTKVTLHGEEAEKFVRARMEVGDGTNVERMNRQNTYMTSVISVMNKRISADPGFGETFLQAMQKLATTNMTVKRLAEELNKAYCYEVMPVDHPEGEHSIGEGGFMEFHMRENAAAEWVLDNLYTKQ